MKEKNILSPAGHRQRVKSRFLAEGLDNFDEMHALELLLFYAIPQKDTKPLAKRLIARFGSFAQVMDTPVEELMKVEGMGVNVATFLKLVADSGRYYLMNKEAATRVLVSIEDYGRYLIPRFHNCRNETVMILCLDAKGKLLCCREVGSGSVNSADVSARRIAEVALSVNATTVVLAHNHPSGIAIPSSDDVATTHRIQNALAAVDVVLADHIIVADDDYVSLVQSNMMGRARL